MTNETLDAAEASVFGKNFQWINSTVESGWWLVAGGQ
jgi:hypothetical protein